MGRLIALILAVIFGCKAVSSAPQPDPVVREAFCKCGENCPCVDCDCNDVKIETPAPAKVQPVPAPKPEATTAPAKDSPKVAPNRTSARPQPQPAPQPAGRWEYRRGRFGRWHRAWVPTPTGHKPLPTTRSAVNC